MKGGIDLFPELKNWEGEDIPQTNGGNVRILSVARGFFAKKPNTLSEVDIEKVSPLAAAIPPPEGGWLERLCAPSDSSDRELESWFDSLPLAEKEWLVVHYRSIWGENPASKLTFLRFSMEKYLTLEKEEKKLVEEYFRRVVNASLAGIAGKKLTPLPLMSHEVLGERITILKRVLSSP